MFNWIPKSPDFGPLKVLSCRMLICTAPVPTDGTAPSAWRTTSLPKACQETQCAASVAKTLSPSGLFMNLPFKAYWDLLSGHVRPQKGRFVLLTVLLFGSIGLRILAPQIMRTFIDSALAGKALSALTWTAVAFISVALIQQVIAVSVTYLGETVAWTATNALRAELAWHA